jgi:membrane fusion protein, multidrug efflux system
VLADWWVTVLLNGACWGKSSELSISGGLARPLCKPDTFKNVQGRTGRSLMHAAALSRSGTARTTGLKHLTIASLALVLLSACEREAETPAPEVRPVRTVTIVKRDAGEAVTYTGRIEAESETRLAFRIAGRMIERSVNAGANVKPGQVLAELEPQDELNGLRSAQAAVVAAQAQFAQAKSNFDRQQTLLAGRATSRAQFELAEQQVATTGSQIDIAEAQLKAAEDRVSYTRLMADSEGIVTGVGAEPGEVVQAGQMIIRVARSDGRDAVFDVPGPLLRSAPSDPQILVSLTDDPAVTAHGRVREVAPQADPVTRTFEVKVGLTDAPPAMRLGATVTGRMEIDSTSTIEIPATALTRDNKQAAVWVVDPSSHTVSIRKVEVQRFDQTYVAISQGLDTGEIVVTAGVQALHPGQKVRFLGAKP